MTHLLMTAAPAITAAAAAYAMGLRQGRRLERGERR
jgi:hypothetical protein